MTSTRLILLVYCTLVIGAVLIVPWTYTRGEIRYEREFAFLLADMGRKSIDYGMIALELVALTCLAGIAYLLRDYFDKLPGAYSWILEKLHEAKPSQEDQVTFDGRIPSTAYWENFWDKEIIFPGWHITRLRAVMLSLLGLIILIVIVDVIFSPRNPPK